RQKQLETLPIDLRTIHLHGADTDLSAFRDGPDRGPLFLDPRTFRGRMALAVQEEIACRDLPLDERPELARMLEGAQVKQERRRTLLLHVVANPTHVGEVLARVRYEDPCVRGLRGGFARHRASGSSGCRSPSSRHQPIPPSPGRVVVRAARLSLD